MGCVEQAANFAGLLAWRLQAPRGGTQAEAYGTYGAAAGLPAALPVFGERAKRRSGWRSIESAVQSRVGDGCVVLPVFPSTKFAVIVGG